MNRLIDLYGMTPPAMVFLFAVAFIVYGFLLWKLMGMYYRVSFRSLFDEVGHQYRVRIRELENKLKEYERTHRTMV